MGDSGGETPLSRRPPLKFTLGNLMVVTLGVAVVLLVAVLAAWQVGRRMSRLPVTILPRETVEVEGVAREYRLVVPDSLQESPVPLLLVFHGALETNEAVARSTQLDRLAAAQGFFLVYPQGLNQSWPASLPADNPDYYMRDLAFFDAMVDDLAERYPIDRRRVYVAGISQGGAFVQLLVSRRSEKIAAAVSHSGWLPDPLSVQGIGARRECPLMLVVGSDDKQVSPTAAEESRDCFRREGHPVEYHMIEGLGHRWALEHDINETIWSFLSEHRLGEAP